jgi:hypothetical protein
MSTFIHEQMKFFFVHVPKTGGTTVTRFFKREDAKDWRTIYSSLNASMPIHAGVSDVRARLGAEMDSYFSFAFYRNTWDWAYSLYRYVGKTPSHPNYLEAHNVTFENWVLKQGAEDTRLQCDLICEQNVQAVTRLIEFSRFGEELPKILSELGYQNTSFKSYNVDPAKKPYRDVYTDRMKDHIGELYKKDIEYFDFSF